MSDPQNPQLPPYAQGGHDFTTPATPVPPAPAAYSAPQVPYDAPPASQGAADGRGKLALILAVVGIGVGIISNVATVWLYRSQGVGFEFGSIVSGFSSVVTTLLYVAALIIGVTALRQKGAPHALAGIAVGVSGAGLLNVASSWLISTSSWLYYWF